MSDIMRTGTKKGRPSIEETMGLQKIRRAYETSGRSARAAARVLGCSRKAMLKIVKKYKWDEEEVEGFKAGEVRQHLTWDSKVSEWMRKNPEKKLPHNYREIGRIVGASHAAVHSWYQNENERLKETLVNLPDIRGLNLTLISDENQVYSSDELRAYNFRVNKWTFEAQIIAKVEAKELQETNERIFPIDNLKKFITRVKAVATQRAVERQESGRKPDPSKS